MKKGQPHFGTAIRECKKLQDEFDALAAYVRNVVAGGCVPPDSHSFACHAANCNWVQRCFQGDCTCGYDAAVAVVEKLDGKSRDAD